MHFDIRRCNIQMGTRKRKYRGKDDCLRSSWFHPIVRQLCRRSPTCAALCSPKHSFKNFWACGNIFEGHHSIKFGTGQTHTNTINLNKSLSSPDKLFQNSKQFTAKISMSDINCWLRQELFRSQYCQWATTNWATYFWVYANTTVSLSQQLL